MNATAAVDQAVVAQILALLEGLSSEDIEEVFREVRSQLAVPALPETPTLNELFDWQAKILVRKGLATQEELDPLRSLLAKIGETPRGEGRIPFLLVPQTSVDLNQRMSKVVLGGKSGKNYLGASKVTNLLPTPDGHYLAVDVEDGRAMLKRAPRDCQREFEEQGRFDLGVDEGVTLVTYLPEILNHHYIDLPGSRCVCGDVPCLGVGGGRPRLGADLDGLAAPRFGSASCGSRLGLSDLETLEPLAS